MPLPRFVEPWGAGISPRIGVNQVIGGAIFLWPAQVAAQVGAWSPIGFVLIGLLSLSVALCFAELSSRFDSTGGPYVFTRAAFGDFVGFEIGWMQWFSRATSQASIMAATAVALGYYWPALTLGLPRAVFLVALTIAFAWINVRGIKQASWAVNVLTVGKLVPLAVFIAVGLAFIQPARLTTLPPITLQQSLAAGLLLIFIYGGYEVVPVPAGESVDPRRDIPFAMVATIVSVMIVMTLTQIVAQGVLPDLAGHATPIADAAAAFMGSHGRAAHRRRLGHLDDRQQRQPGAQRIADALRARRTGSAPAVPRAHPPALPHAGQCHSLHVRSRADPRAQRLLRADRRGERARASADVRRVGGGDTAAAIS